MATQTVYRKADVSSREATETLYQRFPNAEILSFNRKTATADEAQAARVKVGDQIFEATFRVAEFPPSDNSGSGGSAPEAPAEDSAPEAPKSEEAPSEDKPEDSTDDAPDFDSKTDGEGGEGEGGEKPKKMKPEEETVHLLHQILDVLKGGGAPGAGPDLAPGGPGDLDLPDIGAPGQGDALPPPAAPGGPAGKAPLPPPIKEKSPIGVGAFAKHYAGRESFTFVRQDVKADGLGHRALINEATQLAPGYRVARLSVNEVEDSATLTMERK